MTREEAAHIVDVAFGIPQAVRRIGEDKTYHEDEIREAKRMAIKALDQESCEDCVSREFMYKLGAKCIAARNENDVLVAIASIESLPPAIPKLKTGHWEWVQYDYNPKLGNWHCSECRSIVVECVSKEGKGGIPLYKYCPQCGAKMEEIQTGSEKEWLPQYEGKWVAEKE